MLSKCILVGMNDYAFVCHYFDARYNENNKLL